MKKNKVINFLYRMLCGAFLGLSVIAPGISGSIMAVMMGIYDELITVISAPFKNFKKNAAYLFPMVLGACISIVLLINALHFLFDNYKVPALLLFISLIGGSIPTVLEEVKRKDIKPKYFIAVGCAFAFALIIGLLGKANEESAVAESVNVFTATMHVYLPVCGFVAGMMSMMPGMSVSMVLIMFGVYYPLLDLAKFMLNFDIWFTSNWFDGCVIVALVVLAFLVGMVLFSNITKRVFAKYRTLALLMIIGFMSGSIISIFPGLPKDALNWILSFVAIGIGLTISYVFKILGKKFKVKE